MTSPLPLALTTTNTSSPCEMELEDDDERDREDEDMEELDEGALLDSEEIVADNPSRVANHSGGNNQRPAGDDFKCSACDFTTRSRVMLQRHERLTHLKKKFFRCVKCNYVTHVKARYTKHVKYHSMPMIKCDLCEFRTPYKWNLDRHLKNHMGGGMYKCSLCNFTAHIKQSLTVHIQNHHLSPEKARSSRRRNKVGASDEMAEAAMDADELELLRLEREAENDEIATDCEDKNPEDMVEFETTNEEEEGKSGTGLKITFRKIKSPSKSTSEEAPTDFVRPDDLVQKNGGRICNKNLRCSQCSFKTIWESDLARHEAKAHGYTTEKDSQGNPSYHPQDLRNIPYSLTDTSKSVDCFTTGLSTSYGLLPSPPMSETSDNYISKRKLASRPIPNLIPIASVPAGINSPPSGEKSTPTILKIPQIHKRPRESSENESDATTTSPILEAVGLLAKQNVSDKMHDRTKTPELVTKKKSSFFDQLAEKLAGSEPKNVNDESRSVSQPVRNYPQPNPTSLSSRCQHCRQRCKTRLDLLAHIKVCPQAIAAQIDRRTPASGSESEESHSVLGDVANASGNLPHPMENKVFVWTRMESSPNDDVEQMEIDAEDKRPSSVAGSDVSEASLVGIETAPGIGAVTGGAGSAGLSLDNGRSTVRRVYRCPQCSFWATTASRFHVHMVGHTNTKPFECSQCAYRSNWRWDITKHIKLKAARDPGHTQARVVLLDASGERHYDQYDRYLVMMRVTESGGTSLTHGRIAEDLGRRSRKTGSLSPSPSPSPSPVPSPAPSSLPVNDHLPFSIPGLSPAAVVSLASSLASFAAMHGTYVQPSKLLKGPNESLPRQPPPLTSIHGSDNGQKMKEDADLIRKKFAGSGGHVVSQAGQSNLTDSRRTIWKCKRCAFKDQNRETVLQHIRYVHYQGVGNSSNPLTLTHNFTSGSQAATTPAPPAPPPASSCPTPVPAFRCGVCNQVSNWKHVIQRHCRLKHNGNIQVIENKVTEEDGPELSREGDSPQRSKNSGQLSSKRGSTKLMSNIPMVEEDSMGYIMHPDRQQYLCSTCPFVCKSLTDIEVHRQHHKPGSSRPMKCTFCPYFVSEKQDLVQHLFLHGLRDMKVDSMANSPSVAEKVDNKPQDEAAMGSDNGNKRYKCGSCPYVSDSKSQFIYHKQFHRPRGAPYKCPKCSYNVSRRHLLNQHLKVHGLPPVKGEATCAGGSDQYGSDSDLGGFGSEAEAEAAEANEIAEDELEVEPPITNENSNASGSEGYTHLGIDPNALPKLIDTSTVNMTDIPLTWVSRGNKFYKMFKCRYCPHVNVRKANIQEHEKRHQIRSSGSGNKSVNDNMHACTLCNYRCNNAGVLSAHVKVHQNVLGIIHGFADSSKSDEEQLRSLAGVSGPLKELEQPTTAPQPKLDVLLSKDDDQSDSHGASKLLHFCPHCPARFLVEMELLIHQRFHGVKLAYRCDVCSYTARQENHLLAHWKVHSREYHERTKVLLEHHEVSDKYPQPRILAVQTNTEALEEEAIDLSNRKPDNVEKNQTEKSLSCSLCPAKFSKELALKYHVTLHGGNGHFRCKFCDYAVKAQDNLVKHEKLHKAATSISSGQTTPSRTRKMSHEIPISGLDLVLRRQEEHRDMQEAEELEESSPGRNGKIREKRYKCSKCPSAFEKKEQFKIHSNLHGSKQKHRCDKCDYAVKYYANFLQHMRKHEEYETALKNGTATEFAVEDSEPEIGESVPLAEGDTQVNEQHLTTAERQQIWLQEKLRSTNNSEDEDSFRCQYCPFKSGRKEEFDVHCGNHAVNGATGSYRCNFCDYTVLEQNQLCEHIQLHFQLKGRVKLESYWKCSNLEIWSEPTGGEPEMVFDEKVKPEVESEDEDALYIDLNTGQPTKDDNSCKSPEGV